jgi:hypothetical protein
MLNLIFMIKSLTMWSFYHFILHFTSKPAVIEQFQVLLELQFYNHRCLRKTELLKIHLYDVHFCRLNSDSNKHLQHKLEIPPFSVNMIGGAGLLPTSLLMNYAYVFILLQFSPSSKKHCKIMLLARLYLYWRS